MSAKFLNTAVGVLAAFFAVTGFALDLDPFRDGLIDDFVSPSCRIGAPNSWEGRPCVVPLRTWSTNGMAIPR